MDGHWHHLVESAQELLESRSDDARWRFELWWVLACEPEEKITFGRGQPECPL
jgi:hypothetical protein